MNLFIFKWMQIWCWKVQGEGGVKNNPTLFDVIYGGPHKVSVWGLRKISKIGSVNTTLALESFKRLNLKPEI